MLEPYISSIQLEFGMSLSIHSPIKSNKLRLDQRQGQAMALYSLLDMYEDNGMLSMTIIHPLNMS